MTHRTSSAAFGAFLLCSAAIIAATPAAAQMGGGMTSTPSRNAPSSSKPHISKAVGSQVVEAQKDIQSKDYQGALTLLQQAATATDRTPYDSFIIAELSAQAEQGLGDMKTAAADMEMAAESQGAPQDQQVSVLHDALQSSAFLQHWQKAVSYGQQLAQMNGLDATTAGNLAIAYYNLKDFAHAQQYAQQSIGMSKAAGQQPDPNALNIVMSSEAKQNNQSGAEQTLEQIAMQNPTPAIWAQLVGATFGAPGMSNSQALYLYRLLQASGAMTGEDCKEMASDANVLGYPTEAVRVIDACVASGKITSGDVASILGKARRDAAADERALPQIAAAAQKSRSGEQDVKLGEDYWGYGRFADAEAAARRGVAKGGLKTPWEGPLLIGTTEVMQGKYADAIQSLSQMSGNQAATRTAHLWSLYAQSKQGHGSAPAPAQPPAQH